MTKRIRPQGEKPGPDHAAPKRADASALPEAAHVTESSGGEAHAHSERIASGYASPSPVRRRGKPTKERLEALLRLARFYRGWPQKEIAAHLDRHVHNLVPDSGVPKVDLVVGIADLLDWPVEVVIDALHARPERGDSRPSQTAPSATDTGHRLAAAWALLKGYQHAELVETCRTLLAEPMADDDFAYTSLLLAYGYEGMGRYQQAMDAARRGLDRCQPTCVHRAWLELQLAYDHYILGNLCEGEGVSTAIILGWPETGESADQLLLANALYVRGSCQRLRAARSIPPSVDLTSKARADLAAGAAIFREVAQKTGSRRELAMADRCETAALELRALGGEVHPRDAVTAILDGLSGRAIESIADCHEAETAAWNCVIGSTVVIRHLRGEPDAERFLAILTNAADMIARKLGHWALRERVWTIEHVWRRTSDGADRDSDWVLDREDIQTLTGTIGRFPAFLDHGLDILDRWSDSEEAP
ncbi:MAG TPA: hypothetical protein PKC43_07305 [Phycisphaerales bacterium]|nr:hypothetical protein [Phycisphaerales bacterium]HMP37242.1 hypothetical protein [Phycisphaerales bacterium]